MKQPVRKLQAKNQEVDHAGRVARTGTGQLATREN